MKTVNSYQLKYKNLNLNQPYLAFFRVNMIISGYISVFIDSSISCRPSLFKLISSRKLFNRISHLSINIFEQKLNHLETIVIILKYTYSFSTEWVEIYLEVYFDTLHLSQSDSIVFCKLVFEKDLLISFDNLHEV